MNNSRNITGSVIVCDGDVFEPGCGFLSVWKLSGRLHNFIRKIQRHTFRKYRINSLKMNEFCYETRLSGRPPKINSI